MIFYKTKGPNRSLYQSFINNNFIIYQTKTKN